MGPWQVESSKCSLFVAIVTRLVRGPVHHLNHMDMTCDVIVVAVVGGENQLRKRWRLKQMNICFRSCWGKLVE